MSTPAGRPDGSGVRVALVVSRFNHDVTSRLLAGAEACLDRHGCGAARRRVVHVPGAWELQFAAQRLAEGGGFDVVVALGALIRGETPHFDYLAQQVARGLGRVGLDSGVPTIFGVLTTDNVAQALARSEDGADNKGWEAALAALELVAALRELDLAGSDGTRPGQE